MQGDKGWDRERGWGEGEYRPARPLLAGRSVFWEGGVSKLSVGSREGRRGNRSPGSRVWAPEGGGERVTRGWERVTGRGLECAPGLPRSGCVGAGGKGMAQLATISAESSV